MARGSARSASATKESFARYAGKTCEWCDRKATWGIFVNGDKEPSYFACGDDLWSIMQDVLSNRGVTSVRHKNLKALEKKACGNG